MAEWRDDESSTLRSSILRASPYSLSKVACRSSRCLPTEADLPLRTRSAGLPVGGLPRGSDLVLSDLVHLADLPSQLERLCAAGRAHPPPSERLPSSPSLALLSPPFAQRFPSLSALLPPGVTCCEGSGGCRMLLAASTCWPRSSSRLEEMWSVSNCRAL